MTKIKQRKVHFMKINDLLHNRRVELGLSLEEVGKATGVSKSTVLKWESGKIANMKRNKIALLANVLKISPTLLLKDDVQENSLPELTPKDEREIATDLEKMLSDFDSQNSLAAMGGTVEDKEDRELLRASMLTTMKLAKQIAKKKFTPKKYR